MKFYKAIEETPVTVELIFYGYYKTIILAMIINIYLLNYIFDTACTHVRRVTQLMCCVKTVKWLPFLFLLILCCISWRWIDCNNRNHQEGQAGQAMTMFVILQWDACKLEIHVYNLDNIGPD